MFDGTWRTFDDCEFQPMSSYSTTWDTAVSFANMGIGNDSGPYKAMIAIRMPVERIIGTAFSGYGCQSETEMVRLGGPLQTLTLLRKIAHYGGDQDLLDLFKQVG